METKEKPLVELKYCGCTVATLKSSTVVNFKIPTKLYYSFRKLDNQKRKQKSTIISLANHANKPDDQSSKEPPEKVVRFSGSIGNKKTSRGHQSRLNRQF